MTWPEPIGENQKSIDDTWACTSYATSHAVESQIEHYTGQKINISPRFPAILAGTIQGVGTYAAKVFEVFTKYGWIEEKDWPTPDTWTWEQYYTDIPQWVMDKALKNKEGWEMDWRVNDVTFNDLKDSPLLASVPQYIANHFVEVLDENTRFDSYMPFRRPLGSYQKLYQFIIKPKNMSNVIFVHKEGTSEYGFYIPATTKETLTDKALNFGLNITKPDGSVDFTQAKGVIFNG